jgi:hypothetical protein
MRDQSFFAEEIKKVDKSIQQLKADLDAIFVNGRIPPGEDSIKRLLEFQKHLREAKHPLDEMFPVIVDTRVDIEKKLKR